MPNENEETSGSDIAAGVFEGASLSSGALASAISNPVAATAVRVAGGIAAVIAELIRMRGVEETRDLLAELAERQRVATITPEDIDADDVEISRRIVAMYAAEDPPE